MNHCLLSIENLVKKANKFYRVGPRDIQIVQNRKIISLCSVEHQTTSFQVVNILHGLQCAQIGRFLKVFLRNFVTK